MKGVTMKHPSTLVVLVMFCLATTTFALPRFALMTGAKCASCHVNPTGGQMRNDYGASYSTEKLPLTALQDSEFTFSGKLNDNISIGGDYRSQFIYDAAQQQSTFQAMTTTLYGTIRLNKKFSFYYKQDLVNSGYNSLNGPEVFVLAKVLPDGWYIKGGDFLPDFGWRIDDHTSSTRGGDFIAMPGLIFIPNYKDIGAEVGGYAGGLFLSAGLFNGTGNFKKLDFSNEKAYVGRAEYMGSLSNVNFRIGASGYGYRNFKMYGVNAGIGGECFALYGEVDWTHNIYSPFDGTITDGHKQMAAFTELDYTPLQGLTLTGRFSIFDLEQGVNDNEIKQLSLGFEFFPYSFVEVRPQYRINIETPSKSNDYALVQMHVWF